MISSHVDHLTDIAFSNQNCNLVHLRSIQAALLKEKKKEGEENVKWSNYFQWSFHIKSNNED